MIECETCTEKDTRGIVEDVKPIVLEAGLLICFESKVFTPVLCECSYPTSWLFFTHVLVGKDLVKWEW